ncbi:DUF4058 family protein [soil metagenome]
MAYDFGSRPRRMEQSRPAPPPSYLEALAVSMIFPGMDPYLESKDLWAGVHGRLIVYIADLLAPSLRPRYATTVEERVYLEGPDRNVRPDVSVRRTWSEEPAGAVAVLEADAPVVVLAPPEPIRETYFAILDLRAGQKVVTVIEVVSPTNKYAGAGRESYLAKQGEVLASDVHLVEIDLLRQGPHVLSIPEASARMRAPTYDYLICVNRAEGRRDRYELYPRRLRDRLPRIRIPLAEGDPDTVLDVQAVVNQAHEAGAYRNRIDYARPCDPPLSSDDQPWAEQRIQEAARGG